MDQTKSSVAVIGGGPAGLMAATTLAEAGVAVDLYDAMPSVGRKFLLAGRGGLNLTHSEPLPRFLARYGDATPRLSPLIEAFSPESLRGFAASLGIETFIGSSDRVFPRDFKAAPMLRAWARRLHGLGVHFHMRHRLVGWTEDGAPRLAGPDGQDVTPRADSVVLALGGASWPRMGSDGAWVPLLEARGAAVAPLVPAHCGVEIAWSDFFRERFAGAPIKNVTLRCGTATARGEIMVADYGLEGGALYALGGAPRAAAAREGAAVLDVDLKPDLSLADVAERLRRSRGGRSLGTHLRSSLKLDGAATALLREGGAPFPADDPAALAARIKGLRLRLLRPRPIAEAISSAGGVRFDAVDEDLMLRALPGVFVAGEMLDWEAPTGGYLLQACFATGVRAAQGVLRRLKITQ